MHNSVQVSMSHRSQELALNIALPWVFNNTPAKCEFDWMNSCGENQRTDIQIDGAECGQNLMWQTWKIGLLTNESCIANKYHEIWLYWYILYFLMVCACLLTHCHPGSISHVGHGQYHTLFFHTYFCALAWGCYFTNFQSRMPQDAKMCICFYWNVLLPLWSHWMEVNKRQKFAGVNFPHVWLQYTLKQGKNENGIS